jgi:hypothetical protein
VAGDVGRTPIQGCALLEKAIVVWSSFLSREPVKTAT